MHAKGRQKHLRGLKGVCVWTLRPDGNIPGIRRDNADVIARLRTAGLEAKEFDSCDGWPELRCKTWSAGGEWCTVDCRLVEAATIRRNGAEGVAVTWSSETLAETVVHACGDSIRRRDLFVDTFITDWLIANRREGKAAEPRAEEK